MRLTLGHAAAAPAPAAPPGDIAERAGYAYPEDLSVVSRRDTGLTMGSYRRQFSRSTGPDA